MILVGKDIKTSCLSMLYMYKTYSIAHRISHTAPFECCILEGLTQPLRGRVGLDLTTFELGIPLLTYKNTIHLIKCSICLLTLVSYLYIGFEAPWKRILSPSFTSTFAFTYCMLYHLLTSMENIITDFVFSEMSNPFGLHFPNA